MNLKVKIEFTAPEVKSKYMLRPSIMSALRQVITKYDRADDPANCEFAIRGINGNKIGSFTVEPQSDE